MGADPAPGVFVQSVPQNSFPLPTGSIFPSLRRASALGEDYAAKVSLSRIRRGNRHFILRNGPGDSMRCLTQIKETGI